MINNNASFGRSIVNSKIMEEFRVGREALRQGDCESASDSYYRIIHFMRIPLIQGVLRSAYELSQTTNNDHNLYERGRGSAYLAALLPDLNQCSTESANIIYDQLKVTTTPTNGDDSPSGVVVVAAVDYKVIHDEIYKHLECLRIDCNDLGGYINTSTGIYFTQTFVLVFIFHIHSHYVARALCSMQPPLKQQNGDIQIHILLPNQQQPQQTRGHHRLLMVIDITL